MKTQKFALVLTIIALCAACTSKTPVESIGNLKKAIAGETLVQAKYTLFSKIAQEEGYPNISKVFSAVAAGEAIHIKNHNAALVKLGEEECVVTLSKEIKSGTTVENLKAAIEGESFEYTVMYPEYIETAKTEKCSEAIKTFTKARNAEQNHARFFSFISDILTSNGNDNKVATTWFVCPTGGMIYNYIEHMRRCEACGTKSDSFEQF
jgi:rubrerythrin